VPGVLHCLLNIVHGFVHLIVHCCLMIVNGVHRMLDFANAYALSSYDVAKCSYDVSFVLHCFAIVLQSVLMLEHSVLNYCAPCSYDCALFAMVLHGVPMFLF